MSNNTDILVTDERRKALIKQCKMFILISEKILIINEKIIKTQDIKNLQSTISIFTLDMYSALKAYLEMPKSNRFWEGVLIFKYLYMIIFESHNKIAYRRVTNEKGVIDEVKTGKNKKSSFWYGKISLLKQMMTPQELVDYNEITESLETFWSNNDWDYITKIRNRAGHYGDIDTYAKDMLTIDADQIINISAEWASILSRVQQFANEIYSRISRINHTQ